MTRPPTHTFHHQGRRHRLYKRRADRNAPWYIRWGNLQRSLDTNDLKTARERAIHRIITPAKARKWQDIAGGRPTGPTLGELVDAYTHSAGGDLRPRTVTNNVLMLWRLLGLATGHTEDTLRRQRCTLLTRGLVSRFKDAALEERLAGLDGDARAAERERARGYCNAVLRQARSLFSRRMLERYEERGWSFPPCVHEFIAARGFGHVRIDRPHVTDDLIAATFEAARDPEWWTADPNAALAFWLIIATGLRKSECTRARWDHFQQIHGGTVFASDIIGKDGERITVTCIPAAWDILSTMRPIGPIGPILTGHRTEVTETLWRRLSTWMKSLGWQTRRHAHELRALAGSLVKQTHGVSIARDWMRHKNASTTEKHYLHHARLNPVNVELP